MTEQKKGWLSFFRKNKTSETPISSDDALKIATSTNSDAIDAPPLDSESIQANDQANAKTDHQDKSTVNDADSELALLPTIPAIESIDEIVEPAEQADIAIPVTPDMNAKDNIFTRLKNRLSKTRHSLTDGIADLVLGKKQIDDEVLEALETRLLMADVGIDATTKIIKKLTEQVSRKSLKDVNALFDALRIEMNNLLITVEKPLVIDNTQHKPYVILMIGVNGVGKTTTIGKLAKQLQADGKTVMLAAGDTFRAAAVEQLKVWGLRNNIAVVAQKEGADTASVIFDALESAISKKVDVLIADTAGRLHTQTGLMNELAKVHRVIQKIDPSAPHEVMLVIDASTGQNGLNQAMQFNQTIPLSGLTLTKLDGTAKGGIVLAIADKMAIPVRFIGVGEGIDDLRPFEAKSFIDALIGDQNNYS